MVFVRSVVECSTFGGVWDSDCIGVTLKTWRPMVPKWVRTTLYTPPRGWADLHNPLPRRALFDDFRPGKVGATYQDKRDRKSSYPNRRCTCRPPS